MPPEQQVHIRKTINHFNYTWQNRHVFRVMKGGDFLLGCSKQLFFFFFSTGKTFFDQTWKKFCLHNNSRSAFVFFAFSQSSLKIQLHISSNTLIIHVPARKQEKISQCNCLFLQHWKLVNIDPFVDMDTKKGVESWVLMRSCGCMEQCFLCNTTNRRATQWCENTSKGRQNHQAPEFRKATSRTSIPSFSLAFHS